MKQFPECERRPWKTRSTSHLKFAFRGTFITEESRTFANSDLDTFEAEDEREMEIEMARAPKRTPIEFAGEDTRFCVDGPVRILMRDGQIFDPPEAA